MLSVSDVKMAEHLEAAPSKKEVLGDHLFAKVAEMCPAQAEKITGILLENTVDQILLMLTNESLLCQNIQAAQMCLRTAISTCDEGSRNGDSGEGSDDNSCDIGEDLFEKVAELEPNLCAQITGMLLEMDKGFLQSLLEDSASLEAAVDKARLAFLATCPAPNRQRTASRGSSGSGSSGGNELGDRLYAEVEKLFPLEAPQITGMLLEMEEAELQKLLERPTDLQAKMQIAHQALHSAARKHPAT